jgi:hypothetical protein
MKIRPPVAGRTTATLVEYRYSTTHKRTMPVRLGSFNIKCDPEAVPQNVKMLAGVELDFATLTAIREYLMANRPSKFSAELVAQCRAELEAEGRGETSVGAVSGGNEQPQEPLKLLEATLKSAASDLVAQSKTLRASGHKLTNQRSTGTTAVTSADPLDVLQAHANHIRLTLFRVFEDACKDAELMVKKASKTTPASLSGAAQ